LTATLQAARRPAARPTTSDGVWVVIAAYNEAPRLGDTLRSLCRSYAKVIVVDDGSRDDTSAVALRHPVWVLRHVVNCGQGAALQTGIEFALAEGAEIVVTFDADGQHRPEEIAALVAPVRDGRAHVALGSRFRGRALGIPWSRRLLLRLGVLFTRVFSHVRVTDTHNGLRALSRHAARTIRITQDRMAHASEILDLIHLHGLSYCEVPVTIRYSPDMLAKGQSSWNALRIVGQMVLGRFIP
jgi:glycosyltransferase involved in cell wall biosynthesis